MAVTLNKSVKFDIPKLKTWMYINNFNKIWQIPLFLSHSYSSPITKVVDNEPTSRS
jgi:hypothetical protein